MIVVNVSVQALGLFRYWVMGASRCLQYRSPQSCWQLFDLCRVHSWNSCLVKVEHDVFLKVLPSNFTDVELRKRNSSSDCTAIFLVPFKLLRFF